ncbi:hypothetical protein BOTU111922_21230 [Bordetella tumulicola]
MARPRINKTPIPTDLAFFLPLSRPKAERCPMGGQQAEGAAWRPFCRRAAPRQKCPLGGQQAEGAAWGPFCRRAAPRQKRPLGGQQAEGAAWGPFCRRAASRQKCPLGGQQAEGAAWGPFFRVVTRQITSNAHPGLRTRGRPRGPSPRPRRLRICQSAHVPRGWKPRSGWT